MGDTGRVGVGIIGAGQIARAHLRALAFSSRARIVGLADIRPCLANGHEGVQGRTMLRPCRGKCLNLGIAGAFPGILRQGFRDCRTQPNLEEGRADVAVAIAVLTAARIGTTVRPR